MKIERPDRFLAHGEQVSDWAFLILFYCFIR